VAPGPRLSAVLPISQRDRPIDALYRVAHVPPERRAMREAVGDA